MEAKRCPLLVTEDPCPMVDTIVDGGWLVCSNSKAASSSTTASVGSASAPSASSMKSLHSASVTPGFTLIAS
jgi:hypothetical protein